MHHIRPFLDLVRDLRELGEAARERFAEQQQLAGLGVGRDARERAGVDVGVSPEG